MIEIPQVPTILKTLAFYAGEDRVEAITVNVSDLFNCSKYQLTRCDCLPVMGSIVSNSTELNDFSSFIYKIGGNQTVIATLTEGDGTEHIISNNTYGEFYSTGTLKAGVWGFKLDWYKVANSLGFGKYTLNIDIDSPALRGEFSKDFCFQLIPFSCDNADGTVRITTIKNGYIENGFDYRDLSIGDWVDQIRLYGSFKFDDYETTVDNLKLANGDLEQIQTQVIDNYNLVLRGINSTVSTEFVKDSLLANTMFIDDYNRQNVNNYKEKYVSFLSIDKPIQAEINGTITHVIKFTEFNQSTLKRNF